MQASNSGKQHYLRAVFSKAGFYALAVTVIDPVTSDAVHIPAHSASQQLTILPGPLAAERTQISDPPSTLTAGASACQHSGLASCANVCMSMRHMSHHIFSQHATKGRVMCAQHALTPTDVACGMC